MQKNKPSPPWHGKALTAALVIFLIAALWNGIGGGDVETTKNRPPSNRWGIHGESKTHNVTFVVVKPEHQTDQSVYTEAANYICRNQDACGVAFWDFARDVPGELPLTAAQAKSRSASYVIKKREGIDRMTWGCRFDKRQC